MRLPNALNMFRLRKVRWKIMLPFMVLIALFALFATRNVTELVTTSLEERLASQLVSASQRTSDELLKKEREHLEVVRAVSYTDGLAAALVSKDPRELERLVLPQVANNGAERFEVFDLSGTRLYGLRQLPDGRFEVLGRDALAGRATPVDAVLSGREDGRGDKWSGFLTIDEAMLTTAGPVMDNEGRLVGAVAIGSKVSPLLANIRGSTLAEVTLTGTEGQLLASTFDAGDADEANGFLTGGSSAPGEIGLGTVLGRDFRFLRSELTLRGEPAGSIAVALPQASVSSTSEAARLRMSLIFGAITVAVMAIGWGVARNLTGPLTRLVRAARAVSEGDLSARSNVRTADEIGVLGASFDAMAARLEQQHLAAIGALASAIDARDPYTAGHSLRVGDLSAELGEGLGLPKPALHHLRVGGLLHDIGKIGVRDTVLLKPGPLTPAEREQIEQHPAIGLRILESAQLPKEVLEIVGSHHERLNGTGYPLGLSAEELSTFPRITAVADMYDAITTDRPYRAGMSMEEALAILFKDAGAGYLDPEVVATMRRIASLWEERRRAQDVQGKAWIESLSAIRDAA